MAEYAEYKIVEGYFLPNVFSEDSFRSPLNYKPRPDDVFIVTYPKCGTTWTGQIVLLILNQGVPLKPSELLKATPFPEMTGAEADEKMSRPAAIKMHQPYDQAPQSQQAKYIYVIRNPKDCCVSFYHHHKNVPYLLFDGSFDDFFEHFINGTTIYGDYFDHLLGWFAHRNEPNVLVVTYEELKEDTGSTVLKIASFIDDEKYAEPLRQDPEKLKNVLKYSSFNYMKEIVNENMASMFNKTEEQLEKSDLLEGFKHEVLRSSQARKATRDESKKRSDGIQFVRKGIIGDWKNYFSDDQNKRMNEKLAERTKGTEFPNIWKKYL